MLDNSLDRKVAATKVYRARRRPMTLEDWKALGWSDEEAGRMFLDSPQTKTVVDVTVLARGATDYDATDYTYELVHHVRHSPDGFEWGYGGSGPSELARCILIDFFDLHDTPTDHPLPVQEFKARFIESAPYEGFEVTGEQIADWIESQQ